MCLRLVIYSVLFLCLPAVSWSAKPKSDTPVSGVVKADVEELRAGPGAAYVSRGRVYRGESVRILETSETNEWLRVSVNALTGWLPATSIRPGKKASAAKEEVDAGRDRRQSNYQYDQDGRRRRLDGQSMGSGEGVGQETLPGGGQGSAELPSKPPEPAVSMGTLVVRGGLGIGVTRREFSAAVSRRSFLADLETSSPGLATHLGVQWRPLSFLLVSAFGRDIRFGAVDVRRPGDVDGTIIELSTDTQHIGFAVHGRMSMGTHWFSGGVGARYLRHAFRETQPVNILLTTTAFGIAGGVSAGTRFGALEVQGGAGYVHPVSIDQSPVNSGAAEASMLEFTMLLSYRLSAFSSLYVEGFFTPLSLDYSGRATHRDTVSDDRAITYDSAQEDNVYSGVTAGVQWSN